MARQKIGDPDPHLAPLLEGATEIWTNQDEFELEHLEFLRHHPGFIVSLDGLREELQEGGVVDVGNDERPPDLLRAAIADPERMAYPVRAFAEQWGVTVVVAFYLAMNRLSPETDRLMVKTTPLEYVIRIPRPISPSRRDAVIAWLKSEKKPGPAERAWNVAGKRRHDLSPETVAALAWFDRWNAGEEPAVIFRDVPPEERVDFETFHSRLVSAWERMRQISPDGIRADRPSKAPA